MRDSSLYQIDNGIAQLHYLIMKKLDPDAWLSPKQFRVSTVSDLTSLRLEFERANKKFTYPALACIRSNTINLRSNNNINNEPLIVRVNEHVYQVRPVILNYTIVILDYRKKFIDDYTEKLSFGLQGISPLVKMKIITNKETNDTFDDIVQIIYDQSKFNVSTIPSYQDKTAGTGQIYALQFDCTVETQLIGDTSIAKLIKQIIVNYGDLSNKEIFDVDTISSE